MPSEPVAVQQSSDLRRVPGVTQFQKPSPPKLESRAPFLKGCLDAAQL